MNIDIKVDSEAVNAAVVQAVVDSAIGEQMQKAIKSVLEEKQHGRWNMDNALENALKAEIQRVIATQIREIITERADQIRDAVALKMTDEVLVSMSGAAVDFMTEKLQREY